MAYAPERPAAHPSVLTVVAGILSLATGWLSLASPSVFALQAGQEATRRLLHMEMAFLASSVFILLAFSVKSRRDGWVPVALVAVGFIPFAVLFVLAMTSRPLVAALYAVTLAGGVLFDMTRPLRAQVSGRGIPTLAVVSCVLAAALGTLTFLLPSALRLPQASWLIPHVRILGWAFVAAAALLALGWIFPKARAAAQFAASLPFLALASAFALPAGRWAAALAPGVIGAALAVESALSSLLCRRARDRDEQPEGHAQFEIATETIAWGFVLMIALVGALDADPRQRLVLSTLLVACSLFTLLWYHVIPVRGGVLGRTVFASSVYSLLATVLVQYTGRGLSPYFFITFLPILPLAWTHAPQTIILPMAIPFAALLADGILALLGKGAAFHDLISHSLPRGAGLLLISGFAYLLARRNLDSRNRLREAHRQLETVVTNMGEGLIVTDDWGRITLYNPAAAALLGHVTEDLRGLILPEVMRLRRPDGLPVAETLHPVARALGGSRVSWERFVLPGPVALTLAVAATPLLGSDGTQGAIILLRDVRGEMEMERIRDDFFHIASHELRTPLTVMKGNLEMALEASPPPALRPSLQEALASTGRLIRMVNDFLDAARLDHGSIVLRTDVADLRGLVRQAIETLRPEAERKGLAMSYHDPGQLPLVEVDQERVLQILFNIIGNAVRYTPQGRIEIWHEVHGRDVETLVKDTGVGIAPDQHERLFTRFGQIERGLTRTTGGSGLGLYISRRLAEQMGGTVVLRASAPGQGSTFGVRLPATEAVAMAV